VSLLWDTCIAILPNTYSLQAPTSLPRSRCLFHIHLTFLPPTHPPFCRRYLTIRPPTHAHKACRPIPGKVSPERGSGRDPKVEQGGRGFGGGRKPGSGSNSCFGRQVWEGPGERLVSGELTDTGGFGHLRMRTHYPLRAIQGATKTGAEERAGAASEPAGLASQCIDRILWSNNHAQCQMKRQLCPLVFTKPIPEAKSRARLIQSDRMPLRCAQ